MTAIPWAEVIQAAGIAQEVSLEEYLGPGPRGDVFGPAITVSQVYVSDQRRRVRSGTGDMVTSTRTVYAPPDTAGGVGSRVTYAGVTALVLSRQLFDGGGAETPDHVELSLE